MIIAQTCSFWRQLAFETPSLWASFHISLRPFPGSIQFLSAYLSRSKGMPLTIGLDSMEPNDDIILETLLEHSSRWKHLILHGADRLRSIEPPPRLPLLKSVELSTTGSLRASSMFKDAPALSTLILDNVEFEVPELETLPCSQLTSVTVRRLQINDALRVLHACTKLEDAVISSRRNFSPWVPILEYDPPFSLSSLTSLTFTTELFSHLFKSITVPALTSLTVATPTEPYNLEPWPQNEFVTFLERSACPLRRLSLVNIELTDTNLLAIFQHTPLLTHLSVKESPKHDIPPAITNKFLRRLTLPKPSPSQSLKAPPLPQLEFIDFVTHPSRIDYGLVVDLLSSRSSPLAHSCGVSVIKDVSVRQGFIDIPESVVPQHIIPKIGVPLAPLIDRITNRIFALGGSVVTPVFSSIRLVIPGIS
ncbi:hypothetical protein V5O48_012704 [Marasmius crinis-equi]|uniref:F-box domain-containing protein n=1 Tax=Marasmius crinis-equi TaxID=585013 RepID=A0ABR3F2B0_9AGAR